MSYNELEQGYLGLTSQPLFYIGDDGCYFNRSKIEKLSVQAGSIPDRHIFAVM